MTPSRQSDSVATVTLRVAKLVSLPHRGLIRLRVLDAGADLGVLRMEPSHARLLAEWLLILARETEDAEP